MDLEKDIYYELSVQVNQKTFWYKGYYISDDEFTLTFNDIKIGNIVISKEKIQMIKPIKKEWNGEGTRNGRQIQ